MEEDRHLGKGPDRRNSLHMIDMRVREVDCLELLPTLAEQVKHSGSRGARIHDRGAARKRIAQEITVLGERTACEKVDAEWCGVQTVKELPQPQPLLATGLLKVNPDPIIEVT